MRNAGLAIVQPGTVRLYNPIKNRREDDAVASWNWAVVREHSSNILCYRMNRAD